LFFLKMQITVHEDMKAIGARLESLEERMELTTIRIDKLEVISEQLMQPQPCEPEVTKQMKDLQAQLDDLRNNLQQGGNTSNSPSQDIDATSAVIGGLQGLSTSERAIQWLSDTNIPVSAASSKNQNALQGIQRCSHRQVHDACSKGPGYLRVAGITPQAWGRDNLGQRGLACPC
jgi:hypothetical protein